MEKCSYCKAILPEIAGSENQPHKFKLIILEYGKQGIMKREYVACYNCRQQITWRLNEKTGTMRTLDMPAIPPSELDKFLDKSLGKEWPVNDLEARVHLCDSCLVKCDYGKGKSHIYSCLHYDNDKTGGGK